MNLLMVTSEGLLFFVSIRLNMTETHFQHEPYQKKREDAIVVQEKKQQTG